MTERSNLVLQNLVKSMKRFR